MSNSYNFGQEAEMRAADYYHSLGFYILQKNYRYHKAEVDLIVQKDKLLVLAEVKAPSSTHFDDPQSFISKKKIQLLS
jgi:putative endonuclease